MRNWKRWLVVGVLGVGAAVVGGPYVYIHFISGDAPAPLTISSTSLSPDPTATAPAGGTDGTWSVSDGSLVGYRVKEVLFGQSNEAVGRTSEITGSMTVSGSTVTAASFTVDMSTVSSDEGRRDNQFRGRIMNVAIYPTATFTLSEPIDVGSVPAAGVQRTFRVTGELTMHGVTKKVTFELTGRYTGSVVQVSGAIPITFADWSIPNPSFGPVTTEDNGVLEFAINFAHA